MRYEYTHLIPENVAPQGATRIVVKRGDEEVCSIPASRFGGLTRPTGEPDYSLMLWSDAHTNRINPTWDSNNKLDRALTYAESVGCKFVVDCGDFTQAGFYRKNEGSANITLDDGTAIPPQGVWYDEAGMVEYNRIISKHRIPVFEIFGNHESLYKPITLDLARAKELTGIPATAYTVSNSPDSDEIVGTTVRPNRYARVGNDLFILCGQSSYNAVMSADDFTWLGNTLKANTDRRCFVVVHSYMEEDSGDPLDYRENSIFGTWSRTADFVALLRQYPNVVLFHGHSHMKFKHQAVDPLANFATVKGYKSVHVPSLGKPRDINPDATDGKYTPEDIKSSQCYRVDVYTDCIVLNGLELGTTGVPSVEVLGTLKINT